MTIERMIAGTNEATLNEAAPIYMKMPYGYAKEGNTKKSILEKRINGIKEAYKEATSMVVKKNLKRDYKRLQAQLQAC